jgi:choline dehydrogenase-like flavoprotein
MFMDPVKIERSYAKTGHFDDIKRKNWKVISDSKVTKILLEDGVATGVSFQHKAGNKTTITNIRANKEVIIAAGAIHSPQLLQISGIGPSSLLESAGIDTIVDLPGVGQNFQDHSIIYSSIICKLLISTGHLSNQPYQ